MFRINPDYIVAGEIVRTTRMYAMSVSPLPYNVLSKISPALVADLRPLGRGQDKRGKIKGAKAGSFASGETADSGGEDASINDARINDATPRLKRARDFTSRIKIGGEVFEIETVKGKKQAKLPWEKLKTVMDHINPETAAMYKGLRGIIVVEGKYTLLGGEKLQLILSLAPTLEIKGALERKWPRKGTFNSSSNLDELLAVLPTLVKPARWKLGDTSPGKKELGFTGLFTDGEGNYWVRCSRGFHTSLNESLASVETLIDELGDEVTTEKKRILNQCYRRLSDYLD